MFFSVITKNLNWEILTKNFVRWAGVKDEKSLILWGFTEKSDLFWGEAVHEKPIYKGTA